LISLYALVSPVSRLEVRLRVSLLDGFVLLGILLSVIVLNFYEVFEAFEILPIWPFIRRGIWPSDAAYVPAAVGLIYLFFRAKFAKLRRSRIAILRRSLEEMIRNERSHDVASLCHRHFPIILKAYRNMYRLPLLKRKLLAASSPPFDFAWSGNESRIGRKESKLVTTQRRFKGFISTLLPGYEVNQASADDILHRLMVDDRFVAAVASERPDSALLFLAAANWNSKAFADKYLTLLTRDTKSVLYSELQEITAGPSTRDKPPLVDQLIDDASTAHRLQVWQPVGNEIQEYINRLSHMSDDEYTLPVGNYDDEDKFSCPIYMAMLFFDRVVLAALHQNEEWHMWLYYIPEFVKRIVRNMEMHSLAGETPYSSRYEYLVFHLTWQICDWVKPVVELGGEQENTTLPTAQYGPHNGNIPWSALCALRQCLQHIIPSPCVSDSTKEQLTSITTRLYFDLRASKRSKRYAAELAKLLRGDTFRTKAVDTEFLGHLHPYLRKHDWIPDFDGPKGRYGVWAFQKYMCFENRHGNSLR
jgi:hypothetical protein